MRKRLVIAAFYLVFFESAMAADLTATVKDHEGRAIEDAVVLAVAHTNTAMPPTKPTDAVVDQIDKEFVPYVKPVLVGSLVHFPNKDNIRHHVYSFSPAKRFDLPLYSGTSAPPVLFDKPCVVILGCNVHDWMISYVYVADTPYFAKTAKDGKALIKNVPAGHYTIRVWHPRMEGTEDATNQPLVVASAGAEVAWQIKLKPDVRFRRAPIPGASVYR